MCGIPTQKVVVIQLLLFNTTQLMHQD